MDMSSGNLMQDEKCLLNMSQLRLHESLSTEKTMNISTVSG